ncbi:MAG: M3 family metallopeptidase, partial [Paludibacteraceae bacterium]|nr:M3 family metallopeptidase [Paludibacteraceae bacterium]
MKKLIVMAIAACALTGCAKKNPFYNYKEWDTPHGTFPFNEIKMEHYRPAFEEGMKQGLADIDAIVNNPEAPTFENTIEAYMNAGEMLEKVSYCFYNLASAETNDEMQALEVEMAPKLSEYETAILLNDGLFQRIKAVYDQRDSLNLTPEQYRILEKTYEGFADNGANLDAAGKEQLKALTLKMSNLTTQYGQNALNATNAWTYAVSDESELDGLNEDTKAMLKGIAEQNGKEGWMLDLKQTTFIPVMEDCNNRALRETLYKAYNGRALGGEFDNTAIIVEIANTRLQMAQLFGKRNYAEKSLHNTCAETQENVMAFLDQLRDAYVAPAQAEVKEL